MKVVKFWCFTLAILITLSLITSETESKPFMTSMGQSIGGAFFSIWKAFDNTPNIAQNRTSMKRAPAFASKYSARKPDEVTST